MKMAFKGTLKEFKVPDILQLISLQKKTGILTFTSSDGFITLIFENGLITGVDAFPKKLETRVGHVLVKQDLISEEMLQRALVIQKRTNQKIGEILMSMGLIGENTVIDALKNQAVEVILSLFKWKKGEYNFKIMDSLDDSLRTIEPIPTDNLIMEGVQMLDEWPLIKELIPDDQLVFEPAPIRTKDIEIIKEEGDESSSDDKISISETEANILKYINGKNSVKDLVEQGVFTEYKVYKSLYNLIRKQIIRRKETVDIAGKVEKVMLEELKISSGSKIKNIFYIILLIMVLLFILTFFTPMRPFQTENILIDSSLAANSSAHLIHRS
jgi:hypothetical protein